MAHLDIQEPSLMERVRPRFRGDTWTEDGEIAQIGGRGPVLMICNIG